MKKYFFALVAAEYLLGLSVVIVFFLCATGCSVTSHVETAPGVNFNNYKTFGWVNINGEKKEDLADNDIVDNNIKNAISMELQSKGWKETNQNPDVILDYNVMVEKEVRQASEPIYNQPFNNYYYNRWHHSRGYIYYPNNLVGYHTYNIPFKQGTLTVNMIDTKTNKLIWQGSAQGDVSSKIVTTNEMQADVKSIFKKFDVPKTNA